MTIDDAHDAYIANIDQPHGKVYAGTVGRFQEGFLSDGVTDDIDEAFCRAVDAASRVMMIIKRKSELMA